MPTPAQAFKAYYASMTDGELLAVAKNRISFIPVAQMAIDEELLRRQLTAPAYPPAETTDSPTLFARLRQMLWRKSERSDPAETAQEVANRPSPVRPPVSLSIHTSLGATEDQVSMVGTVPERVNKHGTKIEDIAGTGQHDSLGG